MQLLGHPTPPSMDEELVSLIAEQTSFCSLASLLTAHVTHNGVTAVPRGPFKGSSPGISVLTSRRMDTQPIVVSPLIYALTARSLDTWLILLLFTQSFWLNIIRSAIAALGHKA
jgi:hypothetical protein